MLLLGTAYNQRVHPWNHLGVYRASESEHVSLISFWHRKNQRLEGQSEYHLICLYLYKYMHIIYYISFYIILHMVYISTWAFTVGSISALAPASADTHRGRFLSKGISHRPRLPAASLRYLLFRHRLEFQAWDWGSARRVRGLRLAVSVQNCWD